MRCRITLAEAMRRAQESVFHRTKKRHTLFSIEVLV